MSVGAKDILIRELKDSLNEQERVKQNSPVSFKYQ